MTRVGHYIVHETIASQGGKRTLLAGPYAYQWDAAKARDGIELQASRAGYHMGAGAFTRLSVEVGDTLPKGLFTPLLNGGPTMRPRLAYPFARRVQP